MLFVSFSQIQIDPFRGIVTFATFSLALVLAITVHEFSHSLVATSLGDQTSKRLGRLSLNPRAHLDPVGTMMIILAGFGWGKPVPVNPTYLRTGARSGMAVVSLAGPISNVALASVAALFIKAGVVDSTFVGFTLFGGGTEDILGYIIGAVVFWNLLLAAFNLIPIAPLDGFKVALGILPREMAISFARLERYGPGILMMLILSGFVLPGPSILFAVIRPILNLLSFVVLGRQLM